jgi:hypothetical protein
MTMSRSVFIKRYRMQIELASCMDWISQELSTDPMFEWMAWQPKLIATHAQVKWESFRQEMDSNVFPSLANREGCKALMRELSSKSNFVPEATWLACLSDAHGTNDPVLNDPVLNSTGTNSLSLVGVGTIQGLRVGPVHGAIQNIGVVEACRGRGVGKELIRRALRGFYLTGCRVVSLEVTTHNFRAIELYRSVGFRNIETVYKYCLFGG